MLEEAVFEIRFGANSVKVLIIVMHFAMDTMRLIGARQEILFNTFTTCVLCTIFTGYTLPHNGGILVGANGAIDLYGYY
jgi:hypothetical protein